MKIYICLKTIVICIVLIITGFTSSFAQQKKGLLWEISGKGMSHPAYLYGTIHMYDTSAYRLPAAPFAILDKVKKVFFELDFGHIDAAEMMNAMYITDSTQFIDKLLDAPSLAKLKPLMAASPILQMLGDKAYAIKPILLWSIIAGGDGKTPSIDMELYKAAIAKKDAVGGLETVKEEMDALNTISIPAQVQMLKDAILKDISPKESLARLTAVYTKQDIENLMEDLSEGAMVDANFNEYLLVKRNIVMADRITPLLGKEPVLFCMGAMHLGDKTGVIALLEKKGYTLKNIPFNFEKND
ncbi:hypothetical protein GO495_04285 [Chitinophaga oryziterrae]|uniref:TraB/GumN family protein n=1 Tax=Chitinophaga oryziterrae TaxID=1031224 RepID=A0A6N8J536_9BACT|nr:TraB/GumN family protein [Chitinophaga oryziterrae]MVT39791.1 hypothetical protein [Chitinophaga oryziterrae]